MAEAEIQNIGKRKHIRRMTDLRIPLDTPREKIEKAAAIRAALKDDEWMHPEYPPHAYFTRMNADSFNIRTMYGCTPSDLWKFLEFSEKLNFEIFRAFEEQVVQSSLPLRHTYWKHDDQQGPLDVQIIAFQHQDGPRPPGRKEPGEKELPAGPPSEG